MKTAIDILQTVTKKVSKKLNMKITFQHGHTLTVVNYITQLQKLNSNVYPAVIVFTEGIEEWRNDFCEFKIPKIAICTLTKMDATEKQRLESNFQNNIYPIFEQLQKELQNIHYGYDLVLTRTDIPYFISSDKNVFNQLVDGCIVKNLKMKVSIECAQKAEKLCQRK
jgi:hypothetical protein